MKTDLRVAKNFFGMKVKYKGSLYTLTAPRGFYGDKHAQIVGLSGNAYADDYVNLDVHLYDAVKSGNLKFLGFGN